MRLARTFASVSDRLHARVLLGPGIGPGVRVLGTPSVVCRGSLVVGARAVLVSTPAPVTIVVAPGASVELGEDALVESGAVLRARRRVVVGRRARVGVGCVVDDELSPPELVVPDGAWLADGAVVGGPPATRDAGREPRRARADERVRAIVCSIVPAASRFGDGSDLRALPGFDSLAALRLVVALENSLGVRLPHDLFKEPRTVASLADLVRVEEAP